MNYGTTRQVEAFLRDLHICLEKARQIPPMDYSRLEAEVMAILQNPTPDSLARIFALGGIQGANLPERLAPIHAVLEALPDAAANALLVEYFNELYI